MESREILIQDKHNKKTVRRIIDVCMTVLLLLLMAYQVTGETVHEWTGIVMTALIIVHQILNRKWYSAAFRGRYSPYRIMTAAVNILLLLSFALTAFSGMSMSGHAVPFLYGMAPVTLARRMHLSMSHWSFVLMGIHLGLHIPVMAAKIEIRDRTKTVLSAVFCCIAGTGLFLFLRSGMAGYMFFRNAFAFLDYEKAGALVFLENIMMLLFWAFAGAQAASLRRKSGRLIAACFIVAAVVIGIALNAALPLDNEENFANAGPDTQISFEEQGAEAEDAAGDPQKQARRDDPEQLPEVKARRNEENDPVIAMTAQEFADAWNSVCERDGRPDAKLPPLSEFNTYLADEAVHTDHRTRHYIYAPGDGKIYPVLDIYASEKSGELLEAEVSYDEHDYRESTWKLHDEMCVTALRVLMQDQDGEALKELVDEVNGLAAEHMSPRGEKYGKGAVPAVLICRGGIGVYPYFEEGSRSHFCVIPADSEVIEGFKNEGTEIRSPGQEE